MLTIGKDPSNGGKIQVDHDAPGDGYRDLIGKIRPSSSGATAPSLGAFRGSNIQLYSFAANDGGDATHIDRNILEVGGLLIIGLEVTGIPTITGGSPNEPFIFTVDMHYQSTGIQMTKNKNYPFYT